MTIAPHVSPRQTPVKLDTEGRQTVPIGKERRRKNRNTDEI